MLILIFYLFKLIKCNTSFWLFTWKQKIKIIQWKQWISSKPYSLKYLELLYVFKFQTFWGSLTPWFYVNWLWLLEYKLMFYFTSISQKYNQEYLSKLYQMMIMFMQLVNFSSFKFLWAIDSNSLTWFNFLFLRSRQYLFISIIDNVLFIISSKYKIKHVILSIKNLTNVSIILVDNVIGNDI
jgi:hypothetical protein